MKCLVTGATGFLGRYLTQALVEDGHRVRVLVRPTSDCSLLKDYDIEIITGDLLQRDTLVEAAKGQEVVLHNAAKVADWGKREEFYQVNVQGTKNLLDACLATGVKRFIYTSSLTVLGASRSTRPVDERTPYTTRYFEPYTETKILTEKLVLDYYNTHNIPVTIIRPGMIWGPGDTTIFPRIERLAKKRLLLIIGQGTNTLCLSYISNVVEGIILVTYNPQAIGQIYHITDRDRVTAKTFLSEIAHIIGIKSLYRLPIPFRMLFTLAHAFEIWTRIRKKEGAPLITRYGICLMGLNFNIDIAKAQRELGYTAKVPFKEGMKRLHQWYKEANRIS